MIIAGIAATLIIIGRHEVVGGFNNYLPFEFRPYRFESSTIAEPFSMDRYSILNKIFNGNKNKKSPPSLTSPRVYVVKQYSIRHPEFTEHQNPTEIDNGDDVIGSGEAYKKSEFLSNPYIMLRP